MCIMRGDAAGMLEAAKRAIPFAGTLGRFYNGILTFGLEQNREFVAAEAAARQGLLIESETKQRSLAPIPPDCWLQHGLAHALYFQGRHSEAITFLQASLTRPHCAFLHVTRH